MPFPAILKKRSRPFLSGVVDAQGAAEQGIGPFGDLDHDELARPGRPADIGGVDDEEEMVAPALDFAEAGVALDRHGRSGALFAP